MMAKWSETLALLKMLAQSQQANGDNPAQDFEYALGHPESNHPDGQAWTVFFHDRIESQANPGDRR